MAVVLLSLAGAAVAAHGAYTRLVDYPERPGTGSGDAIEVEVPSGASFPQVLELLVDNGVVAADEATYFKLFVLHEGAARKTTAGPHTFRGDMTPVEILEELQRKQKAKEARVVVPEGKNILEVAAILADAGLGDAAELEAAMRDPALLASLGIEGETVEGYLFPDTYKFRLEASPEEIVRKMVERHRKVFADLKRRHRDAVESLENTLGWGDREIVILASIVEKETGVDAERPLIAGVFLNRLRFSSFQPKLLQTDPTIVYGCTVPIGEVRRVPEVRGADPDRIQLRDEDNPYNTYAHEGLPPGPISNPGREALEAVLAPKKSRFLYFVARNDGTHEFSKTEAEHEKLRSTSTSARARSAGILPPTERRRRRGSSGRPPFVLGWPHMFGSAIGCRLLAIVVAICLACVGAVGVAPSAEARMVIAMGPGADGTPSKTAVLPLAVEGELPDADRDALTRELVEGLRRGAFVVVDPAEVVGSSPAAEGCGDDTCYRKVAKAVGASHVVRARVTVRDRDYDVAVALVDGKTGAILATSKEGCEICGIADAGNLMATAAATLRTKLDALARGPSTLELVSSPSDAEVRIDGEIVGTTPLERQVIPGKHVLRVTKEGYIAVEREVTFVEGVQESLSFELDKVPSRLPSRPWGWVSLGVGIASIGAAVGFAAIRDRPYKNIHGKCVGATDAQGNCEKIWNTEWHVLGFALAGAALTTLGVAILLNSARRQGPRARKGKAGKRNQRTAFRRSPRRPRFGVGPGSVTVMGRF